MRSLAPKKMIFHVSFTFLVLLFWTFLVRFSGPPTPSSQKEQENHKIGPQMSRIGTRKVKETQKIVFQSRFLEIWPKNFLTRYARQKTISAYISRKYDQKYTIVMLLALSVPILTSCGLYRSQYLAEHFNYHTLLYKLPYSKFGIFLENQHTQRQGKSKSTVLIRYLVKGLHQSAILILKAFYCNG